MRTYELMIITTPDFTHEDEKKREELVKKLLTSQVLEKLSITDMGRKHLAYEINKKTEGCYLLVTFEAETVNLKAIEQQVKLSSIVVRYLLTRKN